MSCFDPQVLLVHIVSVISAKLGPGVHVQEDAEAMRALREEVGGAHS